MDKIGNAILYNCDCRELDIEADAVVTDPPYGCKNDCNYQRFTGGISHSRNFHKGIVGDNEPFDPTPWLAYKHVALFGYQYFADKLPLGTILVWNKKRSNSLGKFLSDCELAWINRGKGCYLFNHVWSGFDRQSERGNKTLHPTQKPVELMKWVIGKLKLPDGATILDPYLGSGATALATLELGYRFIGCEIEPEYYAIAKKRLDAVA